MHQWFVRSNPQCLRVRLHCPPRPGSPRLGIAAELLLDTRSVRTGRSRPAVSAARSSTSPDLAIEQKHYSYICFPPRARTVPVPNGIAAGNGSGSVAHGTPQRTSVAVAGTLACEGD